VSRAGALDIPQLGRVILQDDVSVGANSCIDRGAYEDTVIGEGTKIDNLVQVAHNVTIGEHCILAGQVGIAGSTTLGNYVVLGGGAGTADHLTIGDGVMAGGRAAIAQNVEAGQVVSGFYAMPVKDWLRVQAVLPKLPELKKTISKLEKQIQELNNRLSEASKGEKP